MITIKISGCIQQKNIPVFQIFPNDRYEVFCFRIAGELCPIRILKGIKPLFDMSKPLAKFL